jgi:hypothetical protein
LTECPLSRNLRAQNNPLPAPFFLYLNSTKTKSPKTAKIGRPFQGFSLKTKGYVEKWLLSYHSFSGEENQFFRAVAKN